MSNGKPPSSSLTPKQINDRLQQIKINLLISFAKNFTLLLGTALSGSPASLTLRAAGGGVGLTSSVSDCQTALNQLKQLQNDIAASKSAASASVTLVGNPAVNLPPFRLYRGDTSTYFIKSSGEIFIMSDEQVIAGSPPSPAVDAGLPFKSPQVHGPAPPGSHADKPSTKPIDVTKLPPLPAPRGGGGDGGGGDGGGGDGSGDGGGGGDGSGDGGGDGGGDGSAP